MPKSLYPQHIVQRFCSDENGTTLRVWNRHQSSLLPRGMRLVSNTRMLRYESCVESAQHSPSIQHMPVHGISGMRLPSHACMLSTSHTNSPLSSLDKAAYGSWGYAAGLKILRSQFFAPAEDAPLSCLPALLRPRLSPRRRSHVPRSHRYRPSASLLMASRRSTRTTHSSGVLFTRNHWKHSSWAAWHSTHGQISPCFNKTNPANMPRKYAPNSSCDSIGSDT